MSKGEKLTKKKKLIISLSAVFGVIIILGAVILGFFCPRKLSNYIDLNAAEADEIYLSYSVNAEPKKVYLDENKKDLFFYCIENTKIIPEYKKYKLTTAHHFYIISGNRMYIFGELGVGVLENQKPIKSKAKNFKSSSGGLDYLIFLFDVPEEEMKYL